MDKYYSNKKYIALLVGPGLLLYSLVFVFPVIQSLYISLFRWNGLTDKIFVGFRNYVFLFQDHVFYISLKNTIIVIIFTLIGIVPLSFLIAYTLTRNIKGKEFFRIVFFLPNTISAGIAALLFTFVFHFDFGIVNQFLRLIDLDSYAVDWLGNTSTSLYPPIITLTWKSMGVHILLYFAAIMGIPGDLLEAATMDGANRYTKITRIVLPLVLPIIKVTAILIVSDALKIFDIIFLMTSGGPVDSSQVLSTYLYKQAFTFQQFGYGSSISSILLILGIGISVLINLKSKKIYN